MPRGERGLFGPEKEVSETERKQKPIFERPEFKAAVEKVKQEHIETFLEYVKKADSVEEAMVFVPGTSPSFISQEPGAEGQRKAHELAQATREKWTPVLEQIRNTKDNEEARQVLEELELENVVGKVRPLEAFAKMREIIEEKEERE